MHTPSCHFACGRYRKAARPFCSAFSSFERRRTVSEDIRCHKRRRRSKCKAAGVHIVLACQQRPSCRLSCINLRYSTILIILQKICCSAEHVRYIMEVGVATQPRGIDTLIQVILSMSYSGMSKNFSIYTQ